MGILEDFSKRNSMTPEDEYLLSVVGDYDEGIRVLYEVGITPQNAASVASALGLDTAKLVQRVTNQFHGDHVEAKRAFDHIARVREQGMLAEEMGDITTIEWLHEVFGMDEATINQWAQEWIDDGGE